MITLKLQGDQYRLIQREWWSDKELMDKWLKDLLLEQEDPSQLLSKLDQCKSPDEMLDVAYQLKAQRQIFSWLTRKIDDILKRNNQAKDIW